MTTPESVYAELTAARGTIHDLQSLVSALRAERDSERERAKEWEDRANVLQLAINDAQRAIALVQDTLRQA